MLFRSRWHVCNKDGKRVIVGLEGKVVYKEPSFVHVDVQGVIYEVFISLHSFTALPKEKVRLFTSHIIREDAQLLYGFIDISEKKMFERLIKISGVGPKVAMAICSTYTPRSLQLRYMPTTSKRCKKFPESDPKVQGGFW